MDTGQNLNTPKSHQRSDSSYLRNYSLLEMYAVDSPEPALPVAGIDGVVSVPKSQLDEHSVELHPSSSTNSTASIAPVGLNITIDNGVAAIQSNNTNRDQNYIHKDYKDNLNEIDNLSEIDKGTKTNEYPPSPFNMDTYSFNKDIPLNELLSSDFDRYGFKKESSHHNITKDQYNDWCKEYVEYLGKRQKKWTEAMKSSGLSDSNTPTRFPPKSDKVKKLIRKGIPPQWRGQAWFFYAGGYEKLNKNIGIYEKLVEGTTGLHNKDTEVIERDLNRTFPDNIYFNGRFEGDESETDMIKSLRRLLIAFASYQPQIGYCQSLNFLAGVLLLFMSEEHAFWMLVILTERIVPKVHSADLEGVHTDQGVLMLCVKEYIPQLWAVIGKTFDGETLSPDKVLSRLPPVALVTSSWFMSLFVGVLPFETVLRVWDILWYEGSKTIFRISLTIFKLCFDHPDFQKTRSLAGGSETEQIELFQFVQNFPRTIMDANMLIDNCYKKIGGYGFGSLSQDEISKCREFVSKQRTKLQNKKSAMMAELSEEERRALTNTGTLDEQIHDVYGFHRSIMSGVTWNRSISGKMKKLRRKREE